MKPIISFLVSWVLLAGFSNSQELKIEREARPDKPAAGQDWEKVGDDLYLAEFWVAPDFITRIDPPAPDEDPFGTTEEPSKGVGVREMLEQVGIPFPEGASVIYDAQHSKLIAVNTRANLELIAIYTAVLDGPGSGPRRLPSAPRSTR